METRGPQHEWLHRMLGEWRCEGEATLEQGKPPEHWKARDSVRSLGGLWVICEGHSDMPDGRSSSNVMTFGYSHDRQCFVGSFIASVMTHMWVYNGQLDASHRVLTLDTEGPSFLGDGKMARYQDVLAFIDDNHRTLASRVMENGQWRQIVVAHYHRL